MARTLLRALEWIWNRLPAPLTRLRPGRAAGRAVHALVRRWTPRRPYHGTFFFRNRPQLELIGRLADQIDERAALTIAVLGCSNGAEAYSIMATIRSARPNAKVVMQAMDISQEVVRHARAGVYSLTAPEMVGEPIFQRLTDIEMRSFFERDGDSVTVRWWIAEGIRWHVGNACDPEILRAFGRQQLVVANNFLCHMNPSDAERCLRRIAQLVTPGGHLVVSGIDLDVRSRVAADLRWTPVTDLLEHIHEGDPAVRRDWPWRYWGLEPLDKSRDDWPTRYSTVFRLP